MGKKDNLLVHKYPEIAAQFHPNKNGDLKVEELSSGNGAKVWWICPKDNEHVWDARVEKRTNRKQGCPFCSGRYATKDNNITVTHPHLLEEWDYEENEKLGFHPENFTFGSNTVVWWKASCGHKWNDIITKRTIKNGGCPYCFGRRVDETNCLATTHPELISEWDYEKNNDLSPYNITSRLSKKIWWKCKENHTYERTPKNRTRDKDQGCPYCYGIYPSEENNLTTTHPHLIKEWDFNKNKDNQPQNFTHGSSKEVYWIGDCGHSWKAEINDRTRENGTGCPYCSGKLVCVDNCLMTLEPEISKEWHPIKNGELTPYDFTCGSTKDVWWKCRFNQDHEWEVRISSRTRKEGGTNCPYCYGRYATKENNLVLLFPDIAKQINQEKNSIDPLTITPYSNVMLWWKCDKNHEWEEIVSNRTSRNKTNCPICEEEKSNFATNHPHLLEEWDWERNEISPYKIKPMSHKMVWWVCKDNNEHKWQTGLNYRVSSESECPYCSKKLPSKEYNLAITHPKIASQWNSTRNNGLTPHDFIPNSDTKVWWICDKNHEWSATIGGRTSSNYSRGCPYCTNRKVCVDNCLATTRPDVLIYWNYDKNFEITPYDVLPGTQKIVWWKCEYGHEYDMKISDKTSKKLGCPICSSGTQTSFPEQAIYYYIKQLFPDTVNRYKYDKRLELNIFIPSLKLAIEYDGGFAHRGKEQRDIKKNKRLKNDGVELIRIRDSELNEIEGCCNIYHEYDNEKSLNYCIIKVFDIIMEKHGDLINLKKYQEIKNCIDTTRDYSLIRENMYFRDIENSLMKVCPDLAFEWHPTKNFNLTPSSIKPYSNKKVWWLKDGREWEATVSNRIRYFKNKII